MKSRKFLKITALLLALFQLTSVLSGCLPISPGIASMLEDALSQASEQHEDEQQEPPAQSSETEPSGESSAADSAVNPLFWEISSEKYSGRVYLFGSIHAARADTYPLPEHIMEAFDSSDALAVECDTVAFEEDQNRQMNALRSIAYLDGTTIRDHLSEQNYADAVELLRSLDLYASQYDYYKPALWTSILDSHIVALAGLNYDRGLDEFFIRRAKESGMEMLEIESVEFQYDMLGGFSDRLQELMLEDYLAEDALEDQAEGLKQLYESWACGDPSGLFDESDDSSQIPEADRVYYDEYTEKMLTERNTRMADAAESYVKRGMNVFLVVGSAHMLGSGGIVELLRARGYEVTEYQNRY